jgi:hypothetical protein
MNWNHVLEVVDGIVLYKIMSAFVGFLSEAIRGLTLKVEVLTEEVRQKKQQASQSTAEAKDK